MKPARDLAQACPSLTAARSAEVTKAGRHLCPQPALLIPDLDRCVAERLYLQQNKACQTVRVLRNLRLIKSAVASSLHTGSAGYYVTSP
jgi:hypothetical protein